MDSEAGLRFSTSRAQAKDNTTGQQADGTACEHPQGDASPGAYASSCEDDDDDFLDPITSETISDPVLCRSGAAMCTAAGCLCEIMCGRCSDA